LKHCVLNQWADAIENLDHGNPGSDKSFGMKQRPDGDIEIDEKFWEEDFIIPTCQKCNGVLKPDVGHLASFSYMSVICVEWLLDPVYFVPDYCSS